MKKSIFDPKVKAEMAARLDKLTDATPRQWGSLNPAQMVHHVYLSTKIAEGELKIPDVSSLFTRTILRYFMLNGMVPPKERVEKNPPQTFDEINMIKSNIPYEDLSKEKQRLKEQWEKLSSFNNFPSRHPRIGKMKRENWGQQLYSHANYHFTQFGI